jgi:hypothetical protein
MQDCNTGTMYEVDLKSLELANKLADRLPKDGRSFQERFADITRDPKFRKSIQDNTGILDENQGPLFSIDEEVEIKGGKFRVRGFEGGFLHLQGVPR